MSTTWADLARTMTNREMAEEILDLRAALDAIKRERDDLIRLTNGIIQATAAPDALPRTIAERDVALDRLATAEMAIEELHFANTSYLAERRLMGAQLAALQSPDLRERLADVQHAIWSHWMRYLFTCVYPRDDGSVIIPPDKVERWKRQANTAYADLTEQEKQSDRDQADKVIDAFLRVLER